VQFAAVTMKQKQLVLLTGGFLNVRTNNIDHFAVPF